MPAASRAGAYAPADERLYAQAGKKGRQSLVPRARRVHKLARHDLAIFYLVELEALRVAEVLEDHLFLVICNSYLHGCLLCG